jgi:hypothetical protein
MLVAELDADFGRGLTDDLDGMHQSEGQHFVLVEIFTAPPSAEADCGRQPIDNMTETDSVIGLQTAARPTGRPPGGSAD